MFPRCVYHQNIFSVGFRTNFHISAAAARIPINPNTIDTIPKPCTKAGRNAPNPARQALAAKQITAAIQSIGSALPPRASSFNRVTRYPANAM